MGGYRMLLAEERELIAEYGRRMIADRLVVGTSGNLSIRAGDLMAVTPTGHAYQTLTPQLVCVHRLDGEAVRGELAPTSELPIHQLLYAHTDAAAVVHTHSTAATVVSTLVAELPEAAFDSVLVSEALEGSADPGAMVRHLAEGWGETRQSIALDAGIETVARIRNIIRSYEPVRTVFSEQGRGEEQQHRDRGVAEEVLRQPEQRPRQAVVGVVGRQQPDVVSGREELLGERLHVAPDTTRVRVRVGRDQGYAHPAHPIGHT